MTVSGILLAPRSRQKILKRIISRICAILPCLKGALPGKWIDEIDAASIVQNVAAVTLTRDRKHTFAWEIRTMKSTTQIMMRWIAHLHSLSQLRDDISLDDEPETEVPINCHDSDENIEETDTEAILTQVESRLCARKREMNGMFSWSGYCRWMLSFPCVTESRKRS